MLKISSKKTPSVSQLRKICKFKRTGYSDPITSDLGLYPARLFLYFPFTPNQITTIWISLKLFFALFLITGDRVIMATALLLFQLSSILDATDGIVARFRKQFSSNGIYIDYIGHYFCNSFQLLMLAAGMFVRTGSFFYFLPAGIAVYVFLLSKALTVQLSWFKGEERAKIDRILYQENLSLKVHQNKLVLVVSDFIRLDNPLNLLFWGVFLGYPGAVLWAYAFFHSLEATRKLFLQFWRINRAEHRLKQTSTNFV